MEVEDVVDDVEVDDEIVVDVKVVVEVDIDVADARVRLRSVLGTFW